MSVMLLAYAAFKLLCYQSRAFLNLVLSSSTLMIYPLNRSQIVRLKLCLFTYTLPMSAVATILQGLRKGSSTSAEKIQIDRVKLLEELGKVDRLQLAHLRIGNGRMAVLGRALQEAPFPNLEELHLLGNSMEVESVASLARAMEMGHLSGLQLLDLSINKIGDEGCKILFKHLPLNSVSTLLLSDNGITSSGVEALREALGSSELPALKILDMSCNHIGLEGADIIARCLESGQLSTLEVLNLSNTAIGDGGLKAIGSGFVGGKVPDLKELDLSSNLEVEGTEGLKAIATALEEERLSSSLVGFHFGGNAMGVEGSIILAKGFEKNSMPSLETLSLWSTSMGEGGMAELARLLRQGSFPKVTDVNLDGNVVTRRSGEAFVYAFRQNKKLMAKLHMDWPSASFEKRIALSTRNNITLSSK